MDLDQGTMQMIINDIRVNGSISDGYVELILGTNRGDVACQYYHTVGEKKAVIFVGGITGGFDSPADDLYPELCESLQEQNISSLRIQYRFPNQLVESALDVLAGITFLERFGITDIGLIGHSFGGAVVLQAAAAAPDIVRTVAALASQYEGADAVTLFQNTSLLLVHGSADKVHPLYSSEYIHDLAPANKQLLIMDGAGHNFDNVGRDLHDVLYTWVREMLH